MIIFSQVLLSIFALIFMLMITFGFFTIKPPASVFTTLFRMMFQMTAIILCIGLLSSLTIYIAVKLISGNGIKVFSIILCCIFAMCAIFSIVYCVRISTAKTIMSGITYEKAQSYKAVYKEFTIEDLTAETGLKQCKIYTPTNSEKSKNAIIHFNYGGWSEQSEDMRGYFRKLCVGQGYSFVEFVGLTKEEGTVDLIVKDIIKNVGFLNMHKQYDKLIFAGGSAGAHLALVTAFSDARPEIYGQESIKADGVIALYPMTDMESMYQNFAKAETKTIFDKLGNAIYSTLFNGTTGTLAGESQLIYDKLLGQYSDNNTLYEAATVKNLIDETNIPTLFIQGTLDSMVIPNDTKVLYQQLADAGKTTALLELKGIDHAFDTMGFTVQMKRICQEIVGWLNTIA